MPGNSTFVFLNGNVIPEDQAVISPNDRGFNFADGTYEVFRTFNGIPLFDDEHFKRLFYSLDQLRIPIPDIEKIRKGISELLKLNQLEAGEATVYIQITRGVFRRMHAFPVEKVEPTVYITARKFTPYTKELKDGVKVILMKDFRWERCDIKSISLLPNIMAAQLAHEANAYEAIFHRNNVITEGSHTNVFGILNGKVFTHPVSNYILSGISRDIIIEVCKSERIMIEETPIPFEKISEMDEIFLAGTSTEVMPVVELNDMKISGGKPGSLTLKIQDLFNNYVSAFIRKAGK